MITLLSNFGYKDVCITVVNGAIASILPKVATCDLTHAVPPRFLSCCCISIANSV